MGPELASAILNQPVKHLTFCCANRYRRYRLNEWRICMCTDMTMISLNVLTVNKLVICRYLKSLSVVTVQRDSDINFR
jgi:hypothetical protein